MSACEDCWSDAYVKSRIRGTSQVDEYQRLIQDHAGGNIIDPDDEFWTGCSEDCAPHCMSDHRGEQ
ncbi:hypothetical protein BH762_gp112 [Gordonia phage OneUp]|uniref:Uncharacterized protein n=1 Tax=Gordonia phage OneUp TaxID=1838074 RepID=A0A166Y985_9CAUD|nr:hypothetical protein BH762_gp112 [Gordonia phage OneUp]ANA86407.1 hypothetical protein PBI_ONEUP_72 [Gordonia phage OneUp]